MPTATASGDHGDCDDTNAGDPPGRQEIPDDRIDQDCSGADSTDLDRDNDGSPRPQDCDDANPRVRPGKREIPGNKVDENCDTEVVPFPPIPRHRPQRAGCPPARGRAT